MQVYKTIKQVMLQYLTYSQGFVKGEEFHWSNPDYFSKSFLSNQITH